MVGAIGHENGVADVYLTDEPDARHQFCWMHPEDRDNRDMKRSAHYDYVTKAKWTKNPHLWEWDGEDHIVYNGQRLMARAETYYHQDNEELDRATAERDKKAGASADDERAVAKLQRQGAIIEDERGRPLKPLAPSSR